MPLRLLRLSLTSMLTTTLTVVRVTTLSASKRFFIDMVHRSATLCVFCFSVFFLCVLLGLFISPTGGVFTPLNAGCTTVCSFHSYVAYHPPDSSWRHCLFFSFLLFFFLSLAISCYPLVMACVLFQALNSSASTWRVGWDKGKSGYQVPRVFSGNGSGEFGLCF